MWLNLLFVASTFGGTVTLETVNQGVQEVYDVIVKADGSLDYAALKQNPDLMNKLNAFADFYKDFDPESLGEQNAVIAAYANAYNVFTILGVMKAWPVASVRKIHPLFGFFTRKKFRLNGAKVSLNNIEKGKLQPLDARIHFIINCASISCPVIQPEVLTAKNVEKIMDRSAKSFLQDSSKNVFDKTSGEWRLSKIFDWYAKDWGGEAGVVSYIRKTYPEGADWAPKKITYDDYNWELNGPNGL